MSYSASKTLPYNVELYRQLKRKRTAFAYAFVLSLPILVAIAVKFGPSGNSGGPTRLGSGTTDLIGLATIGAANFTTTMLYFATPFLLVTVVALFNGDTVASEASWSTLRYLLASPVPRRRLLIQKIKVSLTLSAIAVLLMPISAWIVGTIAFGTKPLQTPLGATFTNSVALSRIAIMTGYLAISLLFVAGLAFYSKRSHRCSTWRSRSCSWYLNLAQYSRCHHCTWQYPQLASRSLRLLVVRRPSPPPSTGQS